MYNLQHNQNSSHIWTKYHAENDNYDKLCRIPLIINMTYLRYGPSVKVLSNKAFKVMDVCITRHKGEKIPTQLGPLKQLDPIIGPVISNVHNNIHATNTMFLDIIHHAMIMFVVINYNIYQTNNVIHHTYTRQFEKVTCVLSKTIFDSKRCDVHIDYKL
jgi:hypothetical protein